MTEGDSILLRIKERSFRKESLKREKSAPESSLLCIFPMRPCIQSDKGEGKKRVEFLPPTPEIGDEEGSFPAGFSAGQKRRMFFQLPSHIFGTHDPGPGETPKWRHWNTSGGRWRRQQKASSTREEEMCARKNLTEASINQIRSLHLSLSPISSTKWRERKEIRFPPQPRVRPFSSSFKVKNVFPMRLLLTKRVRRGDQEARHT